MNTEWKNGYEEGFAAGWKAAKNNDVYPITVTASSPYTSGLYATMNDQPYNVTLGSAYTTDTITLTETKKPKKADLKVIHNLTDHTRIV